ncbi:MAG: hypothetical protein AAF623_04245 [Planctomycetota bacterium]
MRPQDIQAVQHSSAFWIVLIASLASFIGEVQSSTQDQESKPIELSGFSISQTYEITDDLKFNLENRMLQQLLFRISKTSPNSRCEYRTYTYGTAWSAIIQKTEDLRCRLFQRSGQVTQIEAFRFPGSDENSEIKAVYVCQCQTDDEQPFWVATLSIPRAWVKQIKNRKLQLEEPIQFEGFLFGRVQTESKYQNVPLFVSSALQWYPSQIQFETLAPSHLELAKAGFDISLLDLARKTNTKPLSKLDAEAFYRMLGSITKVESKQSEPIAFEEMMNSASTVFGKRIQIQGIIRSCSLIETIDPDLKLRMDLDRYYQVMIFPDLDGKNIVIRNKDGRNDVNQRFPVTVCFRNLPKNFSPQSLSKKNCQIDGYLYRFWRFQTERTDQKGFDGQISPLIIADTIEVLEPVNRQLDGFLYGFILLVLGGIVGTVFFYRYADRNHKSPGTKILEELPTRLDLENQELDQFVRSNQEPGTNEPDLPETDVQTDSALEH